MYSVSPSKSGKISRKQWKYLHSEITSVRSFPSSTGTINYKKNMAFISIKYVILHITVIYGTISLYLLTTMSFKSPKGKWVYVKHQFQKSVCHECEFLNTLKPSQNGFGILQTTFSTALPQTKIILFQFKFHCNLFSRVQLRICSTSSDNGLTPYQRQAIIWTNNGMI